MCQNLEHGYLRTVIPAKAGIQDAQVTEPAPIADWASKKDRDQEAWIYQMNKQPAVYILASKRNGTLYVGVTSDLLKRMWEHRNAVVESFTSRYGLHLLVYFELCDDMEQAILREKRIKKWRRAWKIELIERRNPDWKDLWPSIVP